MGCKTVVASERKDLVAIGGRLRHVNMSVSGNSDADNIQRADTDGHLAHRHPEPVIQRPAMRCLESFLQTISLMIVEPIIDFPDQHRCRRAVQAEDCR